MKRIAVLVQPSAIRALADQLEALRGAEQLPTRSGSMNLLVALADTKVSTIPSSNRFVVTVVASLFRIRLKRICATDSPFSNEPTNLSTSAKQPLPDVPKRRLNDLCDRLPQAQIHAGRPIVFACERRRMGLVMPPAAARNLPIRIEHLLQLKGR